MWRLCELQPLCARQFYRFGFVFAGPARTVPRSLSLLRWVYACATMKTWTVVLLVLGALVGVMLLSGFMRVRAYHRFCLQAARLQDAVRHEVGLEDISVVTDSTAPYGLVISYERQLPPADKARLKRLFHESFPDRPTQQMDDMLSRREQFRALNLSPTPRP